MSRSTASPPSGSRPPAHQAGPWRPARRDGAQGRSEGRRRCGHRAETMVTVGGDGISPIDSFAHAHSTWSSQQATAVVPVHSQKGLTPPALRAPVAPRAGGLTHLPGLQGRKAGNPRGDWCEVPLPAPASVSRVGSCLTAAMRVGHEGQAERACTAYPSACSPPLAPSSAPTSNARRERLLPGTVRVDGSQTPGDKQRLGGLRTKGAGEELGGVDRV